MRICEVLVGSAFAWRRATRERETCWCKRGVSLVSGARYRVIGLLLWILWVTGILGDPMYVPCKNCGTKVDPVTALQAPRTAGLPNHPRRRIVLATVTSADHTGELDRVLVDGDRLQLPANVKSKAELLTLLMRSAGCLLSSPGGCASGYHWPQTWGRQIQCTSGYAGGSSGNRVCQRCAAVASAHLRLHTLTPAHLHRHTLTSADLPL